MLGLHQKNFNQKEKSSFSRENQRDMSTICVVLCEALRFYPSFSQKTTQILCVLTSLSGFRVTVPVPMACLFKWEGGVDGREWVKNLSFTSVPQTEYLKWLEQEKNLQFSPSSSLKTASLMV